MSALKKLILFVTVWAYALQASAGGFEVACPQHHGNHGEAAQHVAVAPVAIHSGHAAHMAMSGNTDTGEHGGIAPAADKPLDDHQTANTTNARCCDDDCRCDSHACSSPASGLSSTGDRWIIDSSRDVLPARAIAANLRGAHSFGLIRPPSIS
ncbi:MAG: hypothetical protein ACOY4U_00830 [Pseudomonadota bacterium]